MKDAGQRWEDGDPHHPKSEELYKRIAEIDWEHGDYFCFKSGGDGDNGETLMYYLDIFFEEKDAGGISAVPYRTPACDRHLPNNESDECPWCRIEELEHELNDARSGRLPT